MLIVSRQQLPSIAILKALIWRRIDIYIHVHLRPSMSTDLLKIKRREG